MDTKYSKYILRESGSSNTLPGTGTTLVKLDGIRDWGGIRHRMEWKFVAAPGVLMGTPHKHAFDEFLVFLSCTPDDELNFEAEIELTIGGETQTITEPSIVCVPEGLAHGPLDFKRVGKPVLFSHIYLSPDYKRLPAD